MLKSTIDKVIGAGREHPVRLLAPLFTAVFLFLSVGAFVAMTGRMGSRIESELPEEVELAEPLV